MFADMLTFILVCSFFMFSAVTEIKSDIRNKDIDGERFLELIFSQQLRLFCMGFFALRFAGLVTWYRCNKKGNIIEYTVNVYLARVVSDVLVYIILIRGIVFEAEETDAVPGTSQGSSTIDVESKSHSELDDVVEFHISHITFLVYLFMQ